MATTPNYGWTTPDDTDLVKDGALAIRTLGDEIDNTVYTNVGGMTLISTTSLTGASTTISSIPATYKDLLVVVRNIRPATDGANLNLRFNADATANRHGYTFSNDANSNSFNLTSARVANDIDNGASNSLITILIPDYANTATWKFFTTAAIAANTATPTTFNVQRVFGAYNQTGAVSSLEFLMSTGNITSGSALLYGVK